MRIVSSTPDQTHITSHTLSPSLSLPSLTFTSLTQAVHRCPPSLTLPQSVKLSYATISSQSLTTTTRPHEVNSRLWPCCSKDLKSTKSTNKEIEETFEWKKKIKEMRKERQNERGREGGREEGGRERGREREREREGPEGWGGRETCGVKKIRGRNILTLSSWIACNR